MSRRTLPINFIFNSFMGLSPVLLSRDDAIFVKFLLAGRLPCKGFLLSGSTSITSKKWVLPESSTSSANSSNRLVFPSVNKNSGTSNYFSLHFSLCSSVSKVFLCDNFISFGFFLSKIFTFAIFIFSPLFRFAFLTNKTNFPTFLKTLSSEIWIQAVGDAREYWQCVAIVRCVL